ncbi:MAG: AAA family ATPase [Acidobacteriota bacterium]|nr:AAA family ATPase [Acidobacteriota bacterium]
MTEQLPGLPYGVGDYSRIRQLKMAYIDKTRFIPELERAGQYLFFLRPRRSGKSLLVSTLACYYDRRNIDRFEALFGESWLGTNPTPEKNQYMVLAFNFSEVDSDPERVQASFERYTKTILDDFVKRYPKDFDKAFVTEFTAMDHASDRLSALFTHCRTHHLKLYILIDEYDNFTNTILTAYGKRQYYDITHGSGFYRTFFNVLKGGASMQDSGLSRLFITGVSPVTMDDVTSGFNIGIQISQYPALQAVAGFTGSEVKELLQTYGIPEILAMSLDQTMDLVAEWYGGYGFTANTEVTVFNPDMVLYFVQTALAFRAMPDQMTDQNVRMDYGKLRHLLLADKQLNGNFKILKTVIEKNEISSPIVTGFPIEELTNPANFISLLYYFGLITYSGRMDLEPVLTVPNRTIAGMIWGQLRDAYKDTDVFRIDPYAIQRALADMASKGIWKPFFELLAESVNRYTSIRDYMQGEKVIQGFLLAYLNAATYFLSHSEHELNKGFCDIYLEPFTAGYSGIGYGYLIELKYIKRGELTDDLLKAQIAEARDQLNQYRQDPRLGRFGKEIRWVTPILVFHGWEMVYCDV